VVRPPILYNSRSNCRSPEVQEVVYDIIAISV
jgi:hypothetical protein